MPTPSVALTSPDITVDGAVLPTDWYIALTHMRVQREVCLVGRATLRFADDGYELAEESVFSLGSEVKIEIRDDGAIFSGLVVGAALEQHMGSSPELVITVDERGYALAHNAVIVPHLNYSASALIRQIASAAGLTPDISLSLDNTFESILQRSNNLDFVDMLVRRANAVWWIDDHKLVVRDAGASSATFTLDGNVNLKDFSVRASALRSPDMTVKGWDAKQGQDIVGTSKTPITTTTSDFIDKFAGRSSPLSNLSSGNTVVTFANPAAQTEAEQVAQSLSNAMAAESGIAKGSIVPGAASVDLATSLTISNVGPMSGTYLVSAVEHVFSRSGLTTKFTAGPIRPAGLVDTLGIGQSGVDAGLTMLNLTTAIVTDGQDPDSQGRVKIKYVGVGDDVGSDWARVLTLGAGGQRGMVFQPEVGDEVLVGFERGDVRRPVVLGGLYAKQADFAADNKLNDNGKVAYRRVTSRKGHVLEFGDGDQPTDQHVLLKLGTIGHTLRLGADEMTIDLESGKPFTLKAGQAKIAIDNQGNINIEGMKITVKAQQGIDLEAQMNLQAKGTTGISLQGLTAELKADTTATLQGSVEAEVKGAIVKIN